MHIFLGISKHEQYLHSNEFEETYLFVLFQLKSKKILFLFY